MYYCCENDYFVGQLKKKIGQDVILFDKDGASYFGVLARLDDHAWLTPSPLAFSGLVEIHNPEYEADLNTAKIKTSQIIGFGFDIDADPFMIPAGGAVESLKDNFSSFSGVEPGLETEADEKLIAVGTPGGFLFAGYATLVAGQTLKLRLEYLFTPGEGNILHSVNTALVNLYTSTSVAS